MAQPSSSNRSRHLLLPALCALAAALVLACSPGEEAAPPAAPVDAAAASSVPPLNPETPAPDPSNQFDAAPADVKSTEKVRCLIDSPPGCDGCDKGDTCVYEELSHYDCVYVVYGTECK